MTRQCKPGDIAVIIRDDDGRNIGKMLAILGESWHPQGWFAEALEPIYNYTSESISPAGTRGDVDKADVIPLEDPDKGLETPTHKELTA